MAIINIRTAVISLALYFTVISTVLGASDKQESQDQAMNSASDDPDVYQDTCVRGSCRWTCNDDSDWCWVTSVLSGKIYNYDPQWVTCSTGQDCATKIEKMDRRREAKCRSTWSGYSSLGDLKCVAKSLEQSYQKSAAEERQAEERWRKAEEERKKAEAAQLKMVEKMLGPEAMEDIATRLVKDGQIEVKEGQGELYDNLATELKKHNEERLALARQVVKDEAQKLGDKDLKLAPEALKERLFNVAKESFRTREDMDSILKQAQAFTSRFGHH